MPINLRQKTKNKQLFSFNKKHSCLVFAKVKIKVKKQAANHLERFLNKS